MMNLSALIHCIDKFLKSELSDIWEIAIYSVRNLLSRGIHDYEVMNLGHQLLEDVNRIMQSGNIELRIVLLIVMEKLYS